MNNHCLGQADKRHNALKLILRDLPEARHVPYSDRAIARLVGASKTTVARIRRVVTQKRLTWQHVAPLSAGQLARLLNNLSYAEPHKRHPEWADIHAERRRAGVTLQRLWNTYVEASPEEAMSYQRFVKLYWKYVQTLSAHPTAGRTPAFTTRTSL